MHVNNVIPGAEEPFATVYLRSSLHFGGEPIANQPCFDINVFISQSIGSVVSRGGSPTWNVWKLEIFKLKSNGNSKANEATSANSA